MSKNEFEKANKIKLGCATYLIEREFVGTVSREELLERQLIENKKNQVVLNGHYLLSPAPSDDI